MPNRVSVGLGVDTATGTTITMVVRLRTRRGKKEGADKKEGAVLKKMSNVMQW